MFFHRFIGIASARQYTNGHDRAAQCTALSIGAGDATAKTRRDLGDQIRTNTFLFGNCQKDAFRSVESACTEEFSGPLGCVVNQECLRSWGIDWHGDLNLGPAANGTYDR